MVKAPRRGAVKTRLERAIGAAAAVRVYRRLSSDLIRRLAGDPRWSLTLSVTPDHFARHGRFWPSSLVRVGQGRGDLGARMARAFLRAPSGPMVLIGSDIPDLDRAPIVAAFRALGRAQAVFGPAEDGGYWLIGLRHWPAPPKLFRGVAWSSPLALSQTMANFDSRQKVLQLAPLADIDDADSFWRWRRRRPRRLQPPRRICSSKRGISSTKLHGR